MPLPRYRLPSRCSCKSESAQRAARLGASGQPAGRSGRRLEAQVRPNHVTRPSLSRLQPQETTTQVPFPEADLAGNWGTTKWNGTTSTPRDNASRIGELSSSCGRFSSVPATLCRLSWIRRTAGVGSRLGALRFTRCGTAFPNSLPRRYAFWSMLACGAVTTGTRMSQLRDCRDLMWWLTVNSSNPATAAGSVVLPAPKNGRRKGKAGPKVRKYGAGSEERQESSRRHEDGPISFVGDRSSHGSPRPYSGCDSAEAFRLRRHAIPE